MSLHNYNSIGGSNSDSVLVQDNDVYSITQGLTGIEVLEANNVTIEKNRVHDIKWFGGSGIIVDDLNSLPGSKVHVVNNLVYNLGYDSTAATPTNYAYGIINYCEGAVFIEHNTVAIHNTAKTGSTTINGIMSLVLNRSGEGGVSTIKNNLVNIDGDGQSKAACIFFATETDPNQTYNFNYNNYYTGGNANNAVGLLNGSAYIQSLADWTAQTGLDSNSVNIDPMFTNAAAANYKPTNYHFDNLGTPLGVLTDLYDTVRSTTHPDIGCIEFNACPPKFAWFTESKQLACIEDPVSFAATDTTINYHVVDEWAWEFGNGNSSSLQNPVVTFTSAGTYNVQLTASTPEGCEVDTAQTITVVDCFKQLFIPNAFTPNGDGLNDVLRVYGNGIQQIRFMVFNQWGEKLFETTSLAEGWDGTQNGKPQPTGVYMYVCQITMDDGRQTVKKGAVNLIR
jgi:gliding motility-associated-like protein